jgi:hypothetical protein
MRQPPKETTMTMPPDRPLSDDEMQTSGSGPTAGLSSDADGTDGDATDNVDGDAGDADGTDADGTDGDASDTVDGDADGTDGDASDTLMETPQTLTEPTPDRG